MNRIILGAAAASLVLASQITFADGRDWDDGPVVNVASIRTVDGHFDEYMHWLATGWKQYQESFKKQGLILSYRVFVVEPRTSQDPDIILVTEFKNWAALDHLGRKMDAVVSQTSGSLEKADQETADRAKIRTVLGSRTQQEALLK